MNDYFSKRIKGPKFGLANTKVNATPVSSEQQSSPAVLVGNVTPNRADESIEVNTSQPEPKEKKLFTINDSLTKNEPIIIASSEFVPIFDNTNNVKNEQGKFLSLKETSKSLNAKIATNIFSQNSELSKQFESNKQEIVDFVNDQKYRIEGLSKTVELGHEVLRIGRYDFNTSSIEDGTLANILQKFGYAEKDIKEFCQTKLWQQALLEIKSAIITHTPLIIQDSSYKRKKTNNDSSAFLLSDVNKNSKSIDRLWWNLKSNQRLPTYQEFYDILKTTSSALDEVTSTSLSLESSVVTSLLPSNQSKQSSKVTKLGRSVNKSAKSALGTNLPVLLQNVVDNLNSYELDFITSIDAVNYDPSNQSNQYIRYIINQSGPNDNDVLILSNLIFKESLYSSFFGKNNEETQRILNNTTFSSNIQIWDYLIGTFPKSNVFDFSSQKTQTLVGLSQKIESIGNNDYRVLTFEETYKKDSENCTPGSYYYIDSCLTTPDGKSFDSYRIDRLITYFEEAKQISSDVMSLLGHEVKNPGINESYEKISDTLTYENLVNRLSIVSNYYGNMVSKQRNGSGPPKNSLDNFLFVRFSSLLCKFASDNIKSDFIKFLFLWIMCEVLLENPVDINAIISTKNKIRDRLYRFIKFEFPNSNLTDGEMTYSFLANRAFFLGGKLSPDSSNILSDLNFLDTSQGLWKVIVDIMNDVNKKSFLFSGQFTSYTGISRLGYLYTYFLLLMKTISNMTPEKIIGKYTYIPIEYRQVLGRRSSYAQEGIVVTGIDFSYYIPQDGKQPPPPQDSLITSTSQNNPPQESTERPTKILQAISSIKNEESTIINSFSTIRKILFSTKDRLENFKEQLKNNYESYIAQVQSLLSSDSGLSDEQKKAIFNLVFTKEQLMMTNYVMSELEDRVNNSDDAESKLKSHPYFADFPKDFTNYVSINETDAVSYSMLSPYLSSPEFLSAKANNKKLICVGLPPGLVRSLRSASAIYDGSSSSSAQSLQNIVRIKVYKLDRLHPHVVYHPQSFLFEMNRFPTRMISNWNFNSFIKNETNLFTIPTKVYRNGVFQLNKDFSDAFPEIYYGPSGERGCLSQEDRYKIYLNHATSFISEEYLRWFTDCQFDETRYNNFNLSGQYVDNIATQYENFLNLIRVSGTSSTASTLNSRASVVSANFEDPLSGTKFSIPVKAVSSNTVSASTKNQNLALKKSINIPLDGSIKQYLSNETLLLDVNHHKRRAIYPKKFDRVFSIVFDPDDFYVDDKITSTSDLKSLAEANVIVSENAAGTTHRYRHRDTAPEDPTLEEYFVTVEPYSYVENTTERN